MRWATSVATLAIACCALIGLAFLEQALRKDRAHTSRTVLFTAPHAEFAPFQRVWNPDTNNDYTPKDFDDDSSSEYGDGEIVQDSLCGADGSNCPELPAFSGEDYFDSKPIGCCYNKEEQEVWSKWLALKNRVAKLEGTVRALQKMKSSVKITWKMDPKLQGKPGPPGPAGLDGPQGPQGAKWIDCNVGYFNTASGTCVSCTNKPENAKYTSNSNYYSPNTCSWACVTGFYKSRDSCLSCSTQNCDKGMYRTACSSDSDGQCRTCTGLPANADYTGPGSPYNSNNCPWDCRSGFYRNGNWCAQCSTAFCSVGQYRSGCSGSSDGRCVSCTNNLPANAAYSSAGNPYNSNNCQWTCKSGYFKSGDKCIACSQSPCQPGYYRSGCTSTSDGQCQKCTNYLPYQATYSGPGSPYNSNSCPWTCGSGYYKNGNACYGCSKSVCPVGKYRGACTAANDAPCIPCTNAIPANSEYSGGGQPFDSNNCPTKCKQGFFGKGFNNQKCMPALQISSSAGTWTSYGSMVRLNNGNKMSMDIYTGQDVFKRQEGRVALFENQDRSRSVRHRNGLLYVENFVANNYDFAWKFYKSADGIEIYNDYAGGHFIAFDRFSNQLVIVPVDDPRRMSWKFDVYPAGVAWWNDLLSPIPSSLSNPWAPQFVLKNPRKNNLCIDNCNGQSQAGVCRLKLVTCDYKSKHQQLSYDPKTNLIRSVSHPHLCLDDGGAWSAATTTVTFYTCNPDNMNQIWYYNTKTKQLYNPRKNNLCLDDGAASAPNQRHVIMHWCDANNHNQKFEIFKPKA